MVCQTIDQTTFSSQIKRIVRLGNGMDTVSPAHTSASGAASGAAGRAVCACRRRTSARGAAIHGRSICVRRAGIRQWPTNSQRERLRSSEHGGPRSWSPRPQPSVLAEGRRFVLVCDPDHEHVCGSICCRESIRMLVSRSPRPGCCPKRERNLERTPFQSNRWPCAEQPHEASWLLQCV